MPEIQWSKKWSKEMKRIARLSRMSRQELIKDWCIKGFGTQQTYSIEQRGLRLVEEAIEAAQAMGCSQQTVLRLVNYIYMRPKGEIQQELGGVAVTLLAACTAIGRESSAIEAAEIERVLEKDPEIFTKRNTDKNKAGFAAEGMDHD